MMNEEREKNVLTVGGLLYYLKLIGNYRANISHEDKENKTQNRKIEIFV